MVTGQHKDRSHALLSASGSKRWLACTPSAKLEEKFKDSSSSFAKEGTLAHEFGDFALRLHNEEITEGRYKEATDRLKQSEFYSREMPTEVAKYTTYVIEQLAAARKDTPDAKLMVEERLDFSHVVKNGFGTGDATIVADNVMEVIDLKYGKGVKVDAEENPQLMLYGIGALRANEFLYDIDTVVLTIIQPRLNSISSWTISTEDLLKWAEEQVKPRAELAYSGKGELVAGDHCRWCKAKAKCRAFANLNNQLAKLDFQEPHLLTEEEVIEVYESLPRLLDWAKSVGAYLSARAIAGEQVTGYKVVEGKSNRKWTDTELALEVLRAEGFTEEQITNTKIKGIGDISDLMSKDDFEAKLSAFIVKPQGKPVLVPESDKRPAMNCTEQAQKDFS